MSPDSVRKHNNLTVEPIAPWHVEPHELVWLDNALKATYNKGQVSEVLELAAEARAQIWRVSCPGGAGIVVTRIIQHPQMRECNAWLLAGERIIHQLGNLSVLLKQFAKDENCTVIQTNVIPRLVPIYERSFGLSQDSISMILEV